MYQQDLGCFEHQEKVRKKRKQFMAGSVKGEVKGEVNGDLKKGQFVIQAQGADDFNNCSAARRLLPMRGCEGAA